MILAPADRRAIAATATTVSWQPIDGTGEPAADPGTVTATATRSDGTTVTLSAVSGNGGTASRSVTIAADQIPTVDRVTVVWKVAALTVATTVVDVAGGIYFSNAELRSTEPTIADPAKYPAPILAVARLQVEALYESVTGRGFVPRYEFERLPGCGWSTDLPLARPDLRAVRSVALFSNVDSTVASTTLTAPQCAAIHPSPAGLAARAAGWGTARVDIGYEYGLSNPPGDVKRTAMALCRQVLVASKSGIPDNAVTYSSTEGGWSAVLITPGVRGAHTSDPKVNEVLDRYDWAPHRMGIAR